jgi:hypothetical protein
VWKPTGIVVENSITVPQQNSEEMRGAPHASSKTCLTSLSDDDEPCEIREDPLGEPTRGTDEEDSKVGRVLRLTVSSICFILTGWIQRITTQYNKTFYQQTKKAGTKDLSIIGCNARH